MLPENQTRKYSWHSLMHIMNQCHGREPCLETGRGLVFWNSSRFNGYELIEVMRGFIDWWAVMTEKDCKGAREPHYTLAIPCPKPQASKYYKFYITSPHVWLVLAPVHCSFQKWMPGKSIQDPKKKSVQKRVKKNAFCLFFLGFFPVYYNKPNDFGYLLMMSCWPKPPWTRLEMTPS